jgi:parallel beta-helix repeat protein
MAPGSGGGGICCYSSSVTITYNTIFDNFAEWGGGILIINGTADIINNDVFGNSYGGIGCSDADVTIESNAIVNNQAPTMTSSGTALYLSNCEAIIRDNDIYNNIGLPGSYCLRISNAHISSIEGNMIINNEGGGIWYHGDSSSVIHGNTLYDNDNGSGIYCQSSITISENVIAKHKISSISAYPLMGAGIAVQNCSPLITSNTVAGNDVGPGEGSGIACENSNAHLMNNIVAFNDYDEGMGTAGGIYSNSSSLTIDCCDVYGNEDGDYNGMPDQTGMNGNISVDPYFCDPGNDDYSLQADSPCLPGLHPDGWSCGLIGALGVGCAFCEPVILSIIDVENDQGRQVSVSWTRSLWDEYGATYPVVSYEVYRRIVDLPVLACDSESDDLPIYKSDGEGSAPAYPPGDWHYVLEVPAHGEEMYNVVVPTLEDSCVYNDTTATGEELYYSTFFIRAATDIPTLYCDSEVDSGYSVDNLDPHVPEEVAVAYNTGSGNVISWSESPDEDFDNFRIYRGLDSGFIPSPDNLAHITTETDWTDVIEEGWRYIYKITAMDFNGNESEPGMVTTTTRDETPEVPDSYALYQNVPNPFNPVTTIRFDLPDATHVRLSVYNVKGELVASLIDRHMAGGRQEITWSAVDNTGRPISSGVYFYRLTAGDFVKTMKMVLLR